MLLNKPIAQITHSSVRRVLENQLRSIAIKLRRVSGFIFQVSQATPKPFLRLVVPEIILNFSRTVTFHQEVIRARNNVEKAMPKARQNGRIEDIYYHVGEFVTAGIPVVSFLPDENVKIRFFVPEKELPSVRIGQRIKVTLDGSDKTIFATVIFLSPKAEFTPPMIYSTCSREKLVFMAEALPDTYDECLRPGLPVTLLLDEQ
ncbi:MAG: HlyD family secretion protein [Holosporales bacterium]|jgi:HlyD family secretion protein|nr:HlyD family secretion protein [Holosporales bacterium]